MITFKILFHYQKHIVLTDSMKYSYSFDWRKIDQNFINEQKDIWLPNQDELNKFQDMQEKYSTFQLLKDNLTNGTSELRMTYITGEPGWFRIMFTSHVYYSDEELKDPFEELGRRLVAWV